MSFELPTAHRELQQRAREVAEKIRWRAGEADAATDVDPVMREALQESGLAALTVPAAHGGAGERVDPLAVTVVREVFGGVSAHLDSLFGMQGIGSYALSVAASPRVQAEWLPRVVAVEAIAALCLTEPDVGSDLRSITTTLTERDGELVLDGHKSFITNAPAAAFFTVLAKEEQGFSLVFVPVGTPGVTVTPGPDLIAPHIIGEVRFDGVRVPADARVGNPGQAFPLVLQTLATFRVSVAGAAVGVAQAALDEAVAHTTSREQFGSTLARLGPIPQMLGTSWSEIEQARLLTYAAATRAAADPLGALDWSSMAKVAATEAAGRVTDRCVQMMGRFGVTTGSTIERLYRNARPMRIYEGGNEVLLGQLAKALTRPARG
ncbi:acyl-CoA dehydrogenase family protein [Geodermatophilus marinus]|uniref:acyl-CoA dehydrogenase family protein n=1 Tax=Geodermatophilus sp. LHW52908 TaxID=2303986 RepID=UPI000E3CFB8C|nr:acyl-CoA dehydrogenase family protein [Geodermatophilus sp. LHW52908]RFU19534.1 acyl-CoA dehydrogenase family protein [Geodermatophilus sp. LHW52908]